MEVGDYVRTNRGIIAKIIKVNSTGSITCDRSVYYGFNVVNSKRILKDFSSIIKSSPNIIDLIEVGDYVNGSKVLDIAQAPKKALYVEDNKQKCGLIPITNEDISSVITKEQFESMEYKIGE